jgi:NAD(P)H dehydrogenase (quinone)
MIVITGATGRLGRLVVDQLLARVPADQVGVSVRDPGKARDLQARGVRVRRGDFEAPETLVSAFEGAAQVLLVSVSTAGETAVESHRTAIDAAVAAGAERVLYTSHMGADPSSAFAPMSDHAATEDVLRDRGVAFTSLRNGFYADTAGMLLSQSRAVETGELALPEDGPVAWTTHADLAEAAALALTGNSLDGVTPALTAAEAVDMAGLAALASEMTGRPITRVVVSDADYRAGLLGHGVPDAAADMLLGMFAASRRGDFAGTDPTLAHVLGRRPTPVRDTLEEIVRAQSGDALPAAHDHRTAS